MSNQRKYQGGLESVPMPIDTTIVLGEVVLADSNGLAVAGSDLAGGKFLGVCAQGKVAPHTGTKFVLVYTEGHFKFTVAETLTQAKEGAPVYAAASGSVATSAGSHSILVGKIVRFVDANTCWVKLD